MNEPVISPVLDEEVATALKNRRTYLSPQDVRVVRTEIDGELLWFCLSNPGDLIQRKFRKGKFYEPEELQAIGKYFPKGGVFCDIGTNVGNHTLYALTFLGASRAIVFEPNPAAYRLLVGNIILNGLRDRVDTRWLGYGVGLADAPQMGLVIPSKNLGATKLVEGEGDIIVKSADEMLGDETVDFIKIDVEGMELEVLQGLKETLSTQQPTLFVEVGHDKREAFEELASKLDYEIAEEVRRLRFNSNLILRPKA